VSAGRVGRAEKIGRSVRAGKAGKAGRAETGGRAGRESQLVPTSTSQTITEQYMTMYNGVIDNSPALYWMVFFAGGGIEVMIWNGLGDLYHLATTPKGKLVLTAVVATTIGVTIKIQNPSIMSADAVATAGQNINYYWSTYMVSPAALYPSLKSNAGVLWTSVAVPVVGAALKITGAVFDTIGQYPKAVVGTVAGVGVVWLAKEYGPGVIGVLLAGVAVYGVFEFMAYEPPRVRKRPKLK
jgi:hypothetical protein